ncbi:TonB-dependent receptor [Flavicella sp.]|uniref:TonB-dependent receptor n=1 Tax=Flavicella sp. TaxID=2957742 RepID=UPI0030164D93
MTKFLTLLTVITINLLSFSLNAQFKINGNITDNVGKALNSVHVSIKGTNISDISNNKGIYTLENLNSGNYTLMISHIGYKTISKEVKLQNSTLTANFSMEEDLLNLETVVVTGTFDPITKLESSTSISIIDKEELKEIPPFGTASLLKNILGTYIDDSAGEIFTRVYSRGVSASAEDDLGWYYVSLQEDGLPVSLVQHSYYSPDLFHRADLTTQRVEAIRGGKSSITALNAPGGIYNFISHGARKDFGGEVQLTGGTAGNNNNYYRIDGTVGGSFGNDWYYNIGGHYRHDDGTRDTDFTFSKGGQVKFNVIKEHKNGYIKLYGKLLDDKTNRWNGVTATNWSNPTAAFGQDFNTTSLLMPDFNSNIPDPRNTEGGATNNFNPSQGIHAEDLAIGLDFSQDIGNGWKINNNIKFSKKKANWQTSISTAYLGVQDSFSYYYINGIYPGGANGNFVYRDAETNEQLATADNSQMMSGAVIYDGGLPNDGTMGVSAWYKDNTANEIMDQLTLRKEFKNHTISGGLSLGFSDSKLFTQGSLGYATYEPNPRMLTVTIENPGEDVIYLSDENGIGNHGGLFFENAEAQVSQIGTFINDRWKITNNTYLDLGLRYETINHKGSRDESAPTSLEGGLDGNPNTIYDNGTLTPTGKKNTFNYDYNYLSYSFGINHKLSKTSAIFSRFSHGNKAPELNYYFNSLSTIAGEIQEVNQFELGVKYDLTNFSFTTTAFLSDLNNIGITDFSLDNGTGSIVYTPIQYNSSRTIGLEWETIYNPIPSLTFGFNGVLQNPKSKDWTVYNIGEDGNNDYISDYSGNTLAYNPKLLFNLSTGYTKLKFSSYIKYNYMGEREGNIANAFQLPSYGVFDIGLGNQITKQLSVNLTVTNVFNSEGLANFFGPSIFGGNANKANQEYISENPNQSFVVVPILGRRALLRLNYIF